MVGHLWGFNKVQLDVVDAGGEWEDLKLRTTLPHTQRLHMK